MNKNKTILITGASGFIGSNLARRLVKDGHKVCALLREGSDTWRIKDILPDINIIHADLIDSNSIKTATKNLDVGGVFHLAVSTIQSGITASDEEVIKTNLLGTVNLINAFSESDYGFFVNTGSFLEYGPKEKPVKESDICDPQELYSITKLATAKFGQVKARENNKPIITFRFFTPYGPFVQPGRLIYEVISRALKNEKIELTGPSVTRDFIFVDDIVDLYIEAMDKAREHSGEIFNAGSGKAVSIKELVEYVLKTTKSKSELFWGERKVLAYDSDLWQADMNKTHASFAWRPKHTLEQGIEKTINWIKENNKNI